MVAAPASGIRREALPEADARRERIQALVASFHVPIWRFLRRQGLPVAQADEVVQEVFLVAFRRGEDLREGSERSFLFATAFRLAKDVRRKQGREPVVEQMEDAPIPDPASDPEKTFDRKQTRELAYRLLSELDESVRTPFIMFEIEGMSMKEIAHVMGLPVATVGSRLRRAREDFQARVHRYRSRLRGEL